MEDSLSVVKVSNITKQFLDFHYTVNDDDTMTTIGGHLVAHASYNCICHKDAGEYILFIMKETFRENWLRNFNNYQQLVIDHNNANPNTKISIPQCKQALLPQEPSPSLQHFRHIQETQRPTKHRRTKQQNNNRSNAWDDPPSIIHQHTVSPNDTQTRSDASSLNDATNTITKSDISILTQSIMTQMEEKFEAALARNEA